MVKSKDLVLVRKNGLVSGLDIPLVVIRRRTESIDCESVVFELPRNFTYASGHWMDIHFPFGNITDVKTFSFASSPTEPQLVISYKIGVSDFKRALSATSAGDTMRITQYGGIFQFNTRTPAVMIAGGIGIAPFRSMIKEAVDTKTAVDLVLIYVNSSDDYPFRHELDVWESSLDGLTVHYINTKTEGRMTEKRIKKLVSDIADREGYVAGPPGIVYRTEEMLLALGMKGYRIHTDSFDGY